MRRNLSAAILGLGLGFCLSGQALAEERTLSRDTSPPVITAVVSGTQGTNGWYTSNVGLTWSVTDAQSAITSRSGCGAVSITTDTSGAIYTCSATSGGGTSSKSVTIKRDATRPTVTIVKPAGNATYALNQAVNAGYSCSDATSPVASCIGTVANGAPINTASTGAKSFSVTARDSAGNQATQTVTYTVAGTAAGDTTPPLVTPVLTGTLGSNGWYTSNVGLTWTVTDPESAIAATTGCGAASINSDTTGTTYTCTAKSSGGTTTKSVTIKRDATSPRPAITTPGSGATYSQGQAVTANFSCSDATSGFPPAAGRSPMAP